MVSEGTAWQRQHLSRNCFGTSNAIRRDAARKGGRFATFLICDRGPVRDIDPIPNQVETKTPRTALFWMALLTDNPKTEGLVVQPPFRTTASGAWPAGSLASSPCFDPFGLKVDQSQPRWEQTYNYKRCRRNRAHARHLERHSVTPSLGIEPSPDALTL